MKINVPITPEMISDSVRKTFLERHHEHGPLHPMDSALGKCWIWTGTMHKSTGYGGFKLNGVLLKAHRVAFVIAKGPIPDDLIIRHTCHNTACVNPEHLLTGTHQDNANDKVAAGRSVKSEECSKAKLTWDQVDRIRELGSLGATNKELAVIFGVGSEAIWKIRTHRQWKITKKLREQLKGIEL